MAVMVTRPPDVPRHLSRRRPQLAPARTAAPRRRSCRPRPLAYGRRAARINARFVDGPIRELRGRDPHPGIEATNAAFGAQENPVGLRVVLLPVPSVHERNARGRWKRRRSGQPAGSRCSIAAPGRARQDFSRGQPPRHNRVRGDGGDVGRTLLEFFDLLGRQTGPRGRASCAAFSGVLIGTPRRGRRRGRRPPGGHTA